MSTNDDERLPIASTQNEKLRSPEQETYIECPNRCGATLVLYLQDGELWCHRCMEEFEVKLVRGY